MTDHQIERLADQVISAFVQSTPPVDLERIAREEGIELAEGAFDDDFHGRIEYLAEAGSFVIYHPNIAANQYPSRVRFSIAHELGHYYIPAHREMLMKGCAHNSMEGFNHKDLIEHQADTFAAALLIPTSALKQRMGRRGFLSLPQILALAEDCRASVQATAFRYTKFTKEPHLAFVSEQKTVLYCFSSEEARAIGYGTLRNQNVPSSSATALASGSFQMEDGKIDCDLWFPDRDSHAELWEESIKLGASNRVLTLLSWVNYEPNDG